MKDYDILLKTPIGDKAGRMSVADDHGRLEGELEVLEHATRFAGERDENGFCRVTGQLITALSTVPFEATGYMGEGRLELTFRHKRQSFQIVGRVSTPGEGGAF